PPPEPESPYPFIRLMYRFLNNIGNAIKIANAAPNPYGNGKIICSPILMPNEAKRKIK
ncbi:hypothetical protein BG20_I1413, partial [Candidatus Nitrosarchaeum limnium BG20]